MPCPIDRFSDRVENYMKFRPSYPPAAIDLLVTQCGLGPELTVADVGSGTGIFSHLLLARGARVFCVEPNEAMRTAAEQLLAHDPNFNSVPAPAEETTLPTHSVDLITAAQSFHWFGVGATVHEFRRILRPGGWIALLWNQRHASLPFETAYEALLHKFAPEYGTVTHRNVGDGEIAALFYPAAYAVAQFENHQHFGFDGLKGRLLSSSYSPAPDHPNYEPLIQELSALFDRFAVAGKLTFRYITYVYYGQLEGYI